VATLLCVTLLICFLPQAPATVGIRLLMSMSSLTGGCKFLFSRVCSIIQTHQCLQFSPFETSSLSNS
jgi:hypothetical protein